MFRFPFVLYLLAGIQLFVACSKKDRSIPPNEQNSDSLFFITKTVQTDLNAFDIYYTVQPQATNRPKKVGITLQETNQAGVKKIIPLLNINFLATFNSTYQLSNLEGDKNFTITPYWLINEDTVFGSPSTIRTVSLKINNEREDVTFIRSAPSGIGTNIPDSARLSSIELTINGMACNINGLVQGTVLFDVPDNLQSGYAKLQIKRGGMTATLDSIWILFGKVRSLDDFPVQPGGDGGNNYRVGKIPFNHQGKGYIYGGQYHRTVYLDNGEMKEIPDYFIEYDPQSKIWKNIPYGDNLFIRNGDAITVNGDAYLIGGFIDTMTNISNYTYLKHIHKFDRAAQKFIPVAPIPWDLVRGRYISFSVNNKLYIGLGEGGNWMGMKLYNDLWEFNPATNSWVQKNNFPGRLRSDAATFIINGIMYMIGGRYLSHDGFITDEESDELWKYDPLADQWTQVLYDKSKGPEPFFAATTISHDGFGYILGGFTRVLTPSGYIIVETQNYRYDPGTNSFEKICNNVSGTVIHSEGNKFILVYKGVYGDQSYYSKNMYELILE